MTETTRCARCRQTKPTAAFPDLPPGVYPPGKRSTCEPCSAALDAAHAYGTDYGARAAEGFARDIDRARGAAFRGPFR